MGIPGWGGGRVGVWGRKPSVNHTYDGPPVGGPPEIYGDYNYLTKYVSAQKSLGHIQAFMSK